MPQADVITNGAIIISSFPFFILVHLVFADVYDDSAIEDRLYDLMETTTDTERSINIHESLLQELIATIPAYVNGLFLTNFLTLKNWINSYCYIFSQFDSFIQSDIRILMNTYLFDIYATNSILFEMEDFLYFNSFTIFFDVEPFGFVDHQEFMLNSDGDIVFGQPVYETTQVFIKDSDLMDVYDPISGTINFISADDIDDVKYIIDDMLKEDFDTKFSIPLGLSLPVQCLLEEEYIKSVIYSYYGFELNSDDFYTELCKAEISYEVDGGFDYSLNVSDYPDSNLDEPETYGPLSLEELDFDPNIISLIYKEFFTFSELMNFSDSSILEDVECINEIEISRISRFSLETIMDISKTNYSFLKRKFMIRSYLAKMRNEIDESSYISDNYLFYLTYWNTASLDYWHFVNFPQYLNVKTKV